MESSFYSSAYKKARWVIYSNGSALSSNNCFKSQPLNSAQSEHHICESSWILMMTTFLNRKMKAKFAQILLESLLPLCPVYVHGAVLLGSPVLRSPCSFLTKTAGPARCTCARLYQLSHWLGSLSHTQYLMRHWSSSFSFLFAAPVTFLSEPEKICTVTVAEGRQSLTSGLAIGE